MTENNSGNYAEDLRTFDVFGNLTELVQLGDTALGNRRCDDGDAYALNTDGYIVNTPWRVEVDAGSTSDEGASWPSAVLPTTGRPSRRPRPRAT